MKNTLKIAAVAATTLLAGVSGAAAQERIIMVTHGLASDPYWTIVKNGGDLAAKEMGVKFDYLAPETFDMVRMSELITSAVNQKPDGIIVTIPDPAALKDAITAAVASGIPVVSANSGADVAKEFGTLIHIGQNEYDAGKAVGERLKENGSKKAICINHEVGNAALDDRCRGVTDGMGGAVTVLPTTADFQEVQSKVTAALSSDPTVNGGAKVGHGGGAKPGQLVRMCAMASALPT